MNPETLGNGPDSSSNILFKRKRGRPRKDQNQNISRIANILSMRNQIQDHGYNSPGLARTNGDHFSHQEVADNHDVNDMVGQAVTGVVEAVFDAGYLLSVKVGNSETNLRGVVFKPGHYVPVSAENDLAPHMQMISRNAVPFPTGFHTPVHGSYRRGRGRGRAKSESRFSFSPNGLSSTGNQLQIVPAQPSSLVADRGTLVPVLLQPADISNAVVTTTMENQPLVSQPAHLAASKARVVSQTQSIQMEIDNGSSSTKGAHDLHGSMAKSAGGVKEELVSESRNESEQQSGALSPQQMQDLSPPLSVEPLRTIHAGYVNQTSSVSQNFREAKTGKMTELLLAVQENSIDKQATDVQHHNIEQKQH